MTTLQGFRSVEHGLEIGLKRVHQREERGESRHGPCAFDFLQLPDTEVRAESDPLLGRFTSQRQTAFAHGAREPRHRFHSAIVSGHQATVKGSRG